MRFGDDLLMRGCERKRKHRSPAKARKAMRRFAKKLWYYECPRCSQFHLTSVPQDV